jgi:hypothetical protein
LIRFFVNKQACYTHLFQSFPLSVFPGVLASFSTLFAQAINGVYAQFKAAGAKGLDVVLAEGVSALDCLGSYCFTGFLKSLIGSVLAPLGTIDSIEQGSWPFIDSLVLNLRGAGSLSIVK